MQLGAKCSNDPTKQHPEIEYYSPAVPPKSLLDFFRKGSRSCQLCFTNLERRNTHIKVSAIVLNPSSEARALTLPVASRFRCFALMGTAI